MGVGLNTMLAAVGATGVAASKVANSFGSEKKQKNTLSQSNDADLNMQAYDTSMANMNQLKQLKKNIRAIRTNPNLTERQKSLQINKEVNKIQGGKK